MKMNANSITLVLSIMSNKSHVTPLHLFLKRVRVSAIAYIKVKNFIKWGGGCCTLSSRLLLPSLPQLRNGEFSIHDDCQNMVS